MCESGDSSVVPATPRMIYDSRLFFLELSEEQKHLAIHSVINFPQVNLQGEGNIISKRVNGPTSHHSASPHLPPPQNPIGRNALTESVGGDSAHALLDKDQLDHETALLEFPIVISGWDGTHTRLRKIFSDHIYSKFENATGNGTAMERVLIEILKDIIDHFGDYQLDQVRDICIQCFGKDLVYIENTPECSDEDVRNVWDNWDNPPAHSPGSPSFSSDQIIENEGGSLLEEGEDEEEEEKEKEKEQEHQGLPNNVNQQSSDSFGTTHPLKAKEEEEEEESVENGEEQDGRAITKSFLMGELRKQALERGFQVDVTDVVQFAYQKFAVELLCVPSTLNSNPKLPSETTLEGLSGCSTSEPAPAIPEKESPRCPTLSFKTLKQSDWFYIAGACFLCGSAGYYVAKAFSSNN